MQKKEEIIMDFILGCNYWASNAGTEMWTNWDENAVRKDIKTLQTTTIIVSQRASSVQHADKIVVLDDGKAVGIGTHEELLASCEVYREIYHSQYVDEKEGGVQV
jgi:ABC-type transporter Mla maintaining outer membrane lipid asymmetry ATPase subunit MlaF